MPGPPNKLSYAAQAILSRESPLGYTQGHTQRAPFREGRWCPLITGSAPASSESRRTERTPSCCISYESEGGVDDSAVDEAREVLSAETGYTLLSLWHRSGKLSLPGNARGRVRG